MELLRELTRLQYEKGFLDDETLRELSDRKNVPLYRLEGLVSFYPHFRRTRPPRTTVHVCQDVACLMAGCEPSVQDLQKRLQNGNRGDGADFDPEEIEVQEVSCLGRCDSAPALAVDDVPLAPCSLERLDEVFEHIVHPEKRSLNGRETPSRRWKCDPYSKSDEYYSTVRELIASDDDVGRTCIDGLKQSGLRGMGGAGFPTGKKWELVAAEETSPKYVICNADESEPGTFKDRVVLDELPHLMIEGMLLAALTIGAEKGIVYLRHEYGREQQALEKALEDACRRGVLGENAAGSGRSFDIEVFVSPGGYILGEETALLEALEDRRGEPRNKPPYPGTHGLWGQPTLINNVETFALATSILHHGVDWWKQQGKGGSAGLKFMSVSGDVEQPGVYEVPLGTTVSELIGLAGGMKDGRELKAFLPGGASSNFLPADRADTPLDFDALKQAGSMLGSGALIAMGEGRDLFALATNVVRFFRNESCGKCVPCRVGSHKAVDMLEGVQAGKVNPRALELLPELGETLEQTSICGLGQVALSPILSMLQHFPGVVPAQTE